MKSISKCLARAALVLGIGLSLGASCTAFAAEDSSKAAAQSAPQFRIEQAYVNAPDARTYFYALQSDGTSYSPDVVGLVGLRAKLNDDALTITSITSAADDPVTYIYVLDTNMKQEQFDLAKQAVLQRHRRLGEEDQLLVYTAGDQTELIGDENTAYLDLWKTLTAIRTEEENPDPDAVYADLEEKVSNLINGVASTALSDAITRAGEHVNEEFRSMNARKVLFFITNTQSIVNDAGMMAALKQTDRLGMLGFSVYGFAFNESVMNANMLQWMCEYDASLLTGVDTDSFLQAYAQRSDELKKALVAATVVDKGLVDNTEKTVTLAVPSMNVSASTEVLMNHELESPSIREVRCVDRTTLRIRFNQAVNGADSLRAYLIKDGMGRSVSVQKIVLDEDESEATLTVSKLYDGDYTVALRSGRITDKSIQANKCSTESVPLEIHAGYERDAQYYWGMVSHGVLLVLIAVAVYALLLWNERRKDRREETVAQAEAYLSGDESAVLGGNDPTDEDPHTQDASLPLNELQSLVLTLLITINKNVTNRMEISVVSSYILGSAAGQCDLRIDDPQVSAQHCVLSVEDGGLVVQDLESRYGTFVNGNRIHEPTRLNSGSLLTLGRTKIKVKYSNAQAGLHTEEKA